MIRVDFEETYASIEVDDDVRFMTFISPLKDGQEILLKITISPLDDPMLPNVHNLAFGPLLDDGSIDESKT